MLAETPGEKFDLGDDWHALRKGLLNQRLLQRHARRNGDQIDPGKRFRRKRTSEQNRFRDSAT